VPFFIIGPGGSSGSGCSGGKGGDGSSGGSGSGSEAGRRRGRYSLSGAQPTAALVQAMQKVLDERQA
jgi:hypothetical protein